MNNWLILGKGFLGKRLQEDLKCKISGQKIHSLKDVHTLIKRYRPKVIINCVGYTGDRNVDDCELKPELTVTANTFVPILLAEGALRHKVKLVHISSGCIYHYDYRHSKPITEAVPPNYFDLYYSRTKIYSERALELLATQFNILITRIRIPLDDRPHSKNVITKLVQYKKIIDIPNSLTYIPDFIKALRYLIKIDARGLYNVVNKGALQYSRLMKIYQKYVPDFEFEVIPYNQLKLKRTNLILSSRKLEKTGFPLRPISRVLEESVRGYLSPAKKKRY